MAASGGDLSWYFSQVKGTLDDDVAEGNLYRAWMLAAGFLRYQEFKKEF